MQALLHSLKNTPEDSKPIAANQPAGNAQIAPFELLIADARRLQLETALAGDFQRSADWADRAKRLRHKATSQTVTPQNQPHKNNPEKNMPPHQTNQPKNTRPMPLTRIMAKTAAGLALSLSATLSSAWVTDTAEAQYATPVQTSDVFVETLQARHRVTGSLVANQQTELSLQESGAIRQVTVEAGDRVAQGDVIAVLDDRRARVAAMEAKAAVQTAEAAIAERQAERDLAASDLEKMTLLHERSAANARELDDARRAHRVAEARLLSSERLLEQAHHRQALTEVYLADTQVTAPYDAWITHRHVDAGDWVDPGTPVVTLVSAGQLEARLAVPERLAAAVHQSPETLTLEVTATGETRTPDRVRISRAVDPRARTFPVIAELTNADDRLTPGMSVTAWVPAGPRDQYLTVPVDAVIRSGPQAHVVVVSQQDDAQTTQQLPVRVLFVAGDRAAVQAPELKVTDTVVIEGNERLIPGSPVQVVTPRSPRKGTNQDLALADRG